LVPESDFNGLRDGVPTRRHPGGLMEVRMDWEPPVGASMVSIDRRFDWRAMSPAERRRTAKELRREKAYAERRHAELDKELVSLDAMKTCLEDIIVWCERKPEIEPSCRNYFYEIAAALRDGKFVNADIRAIRDKDPNWLQREWFHKERFMEAVPFVVNRSYRYLLQGTEAAEGAFVLPFDSCLFQFQVGGRPIAVLAYHHESGVAFSAILGSGSHWTGGNVNYEYDGRRWITTSDDENDTMLPIATWLGDEIRAISIMLEAEVAVSEVVRAPHKLNAAREKRGKVPINEYHTIDLRTRHRTVPVYGTERRGPRLHFRRGHWRHYATWKTWIRWCVVGDPDKGVILSEYKL
jgi:hypothetical protein